ncbi:hypothetical protein FA13DRAFT_1795996 [Coprinellus micaceus]|uniref:Uncharacterized protein n=1 Tax=Coprinellus micaceus TaxID=71717 RepID=A0A4Y7SW95_COPMI|nr:hypothetical protein FA13DRAFT_1795996 [Coprinellus micaceus]
MPDIEETRRILRETRGSVYIGDEEHEELAWCETRDFSRVLQAPPAELRAIGRLEKDEGLYMTACGDWGNLSRTNSAAFPFKGVKAPAVAKDPGLQELGGDFGNAVATIRNLVQKMMEAEHIEDQYVGTIQPGRGGSFEVQHKLFSLKNAGDQDEEEAQFKIDKWPRVQEELDEIKSTHIVTPIPAFDAAGSPIAPKDYASELRGATIKQRHIFNADVLNIGVLVPPPPVDTPTPKRKRPIIDPFLSKTKAYPESPTRKRAKGSSKTRRGP